MAEEAQTSFRRKMCQTSNVTADSLAWGLWLLLRETPLCVECAPVRPQSDVLRLMPLLLPFVLCLLASLTVLAAGPTRTAPESLRLTLDTAIQRALAKNYEIQVDAYGPALARLRTAAEFARFDPRLEASFARTEEKDRTIGIAEDPLAPSYSINQNDRFDVGLQGLLPTGTSYEAGLVSRNARNSGNDYLDNYNSTMRFALRQPLLRDFGTGANLAQIRIARKGEQISDWQFRSRLIDIITQTIFIYNELFFAMENYKVAVRSRELARQLLRDNTQRANIGVMSPLDITTARAEVASREERVILADRSVRDNENFLKQLVTADLESLLATRLQIAPPPALVRPTGDIRGGIRDALELRPDYRQALLDIQRRDINLAFQRNQALPRLDLTGSLDLNGIDRNWNRSIERASERDRSTWDAGAVFSLPLANIEGRTRIASAKLEVAQALVDLSRLEQNIIVVVDNAAGQIVTSQQRVTSTHEALGLAEESLSAGEQRLRAGTGTTFEVLELQDKVSSAEAAELRARSDYNKAVSEYDRQTGTALRRNNVSYP